MNSLVNYSSDEEETNKAKKTKLNTAPDTSLVSLDQHNYLVSSQTRAISINMPFKDLNKPLQGPSNPFSQQVSNKNHLQDISFKNMQRTFENYGYTANPDTGNVMGDVNNIQKYEAKTLNDLKLKKDAKKKRKPAGKAEDIDQFAGPWAKYEGESSSGDELGSIEPQETTTTVAVDVKQDSFAKESSKFHGLHETDYMGRTFIHPPMDISLDLTAEPGHQTCFLPKKLLHTWSGHTKGVSRISFFPQTAHLILSGSLDTKIKIWDVFHDRKCLRTYQGHDKPIKDLCFNKEGTKFLSASHDKWIKLWDTETGQVISRFSNKKVPLVVKIHPDKPNIFLMGCQDKKVYQYDMNMGKIVQEYDQHLGAVNTLVFFDQNRKFVTSSEDKTLRVWDYDIPVVTKYIADPAFESMPAASVSLNGKWLAYQSIDNYISIYSLVGQRIKNFKKIFKGHVIAGYPIVPSFSPDGQYMTSGDASGNVWFWDWKKTTLIKKFKGHDDVVLASEWHPHETSKLATCSLDGTIKYWD